MITAAKPNMKTTNLLSQSLYDYLLPVLNEQPYIVIRNIDGESMFQNFGVHVAVLPRMGKFNYLRKGGSYIISLLFSPKELEDENIPVEPEDVSEIAAKTKANKKIRESRLDALKEMADRFGPLTSLDWDEQADVVIAKLNG